MRALTACKSSACSPSFRSLRWAIKHPAHKWLSPPGCILVPNSDNDVANSSEAIKVGTYMWLEG